MSEPALLERGPMGHARLWAKTMTSARRTADFAPDARTRATVRVSSLRPIREPIFIIGAPRSGTTYLGSLFEGLPRSTYFFEPALFKYYVRLLLEDRIPAALAASVYRLGLHALLLAAPGSGPRVIEKNPNHVFIVDRLASIFPDARFVVITRDGRDVALSLSEKPWHRADSIGSGLREPGGYLHGPYPQFYIEPDRREEFQSTTDLHRCIWVWRRHQEEIEALRATFDTTKQHHLRYEDLVTSPSSVIRSLLDGLEIPTTDRTELIDRSRSGHAKSIGRWQAALSGEDLAVIDEESGPLLRELGYG